LPALLILAALLAAGCASVPHPVDYPPGWVSIQKGALANGCPDLSGTYSTRAADAHPRNAEAPPPLNEVFELKAGGAGVFTLRTPERTWPSLPGATSAAFRSDGDALYVRFGRGALSEVALTFHRIEFVAVDRDADAFFNCPPSAAGPAVRFASDRASIGGVPYVYSEFDMDVVLLFKAADGSLMVNYRTERIFLTSVVVGSQGETLRSRWWRYPPVAPKP
jgi:hypothetical protein